MALEIFETDKLLMKSKEIDFHGLSRINIFIKVPILFGQEFFCSL